MNYDLNYDEEEYQKGGIILDSGPLMWLFIGFVFLWVFLGLTAYVMCIVCYFQSGSLVEKTLGLIIAVLLGPLYWIYYALMKNYCRDNIPKPIIV